jgi:hypothetical protein
LIVTIREGKGYSVVSMEGTCKSSFTEEKMKLTPPKVVTFWVAVVLAALGLLGHLGVLAFAAPYAFWLAFFAAALMVVATFVKGL